MMYSSVDIKKAQNQGDIYICPYDPKNIKGASLNITASLFALSAKNGLLMKVYDKKGCKYIDIDSDDTALILTREYIKINSGMIAGTIHSKVRLVCEGYGAICATSDPWWQGSLLMAINNPTSRRRRFKLYDPDNGYISIGTIVFYDLKTESDVVHDNLPARYDILKDYVGKSANLRKKLIFNKQFVLLDNIIDILTEEIGRKPIKQDDFKSLNNTKNFLIAIRTLLSDKLYNKAEQKATELVNSFTFYDYSTTLHDDIFNLCSRINSSISDKEKDNIIIELERLLKLCDLEFEGLNWTTHLNTIEAKIDEYSKSSSVLFWILKWVNLHNFVLIASLIGLIITIYVQLNASQPSPYLSALCGFLGSVIVLFLSTIQKK